MLFSQVRDKKQGHRCILDGLNPGLIIGDTGDFIPFVIEEETQFCMFFMYPPPTSSARHAGLYSSSTRVLNLEESGKSSSKAHVLIFNLLVSHHNRKTSNCLRSRAISFSAKDNSNDRLRFLQSLLKRKTAPISDSALDNDHLNSATTEPYFQDSITIDDSFDDEQVTNLMQDVDNLSKVPAFNILDSETRR